MKKAIITACLNPVTRETVRCDIPATGRLSSHIDIPPGVTVWRNGRAYRDGLLRDGDVINIVQAPQGDGGDVNEGKQIIRTTALLAFSNAIFPGSGFFAVLGRAAIVYGGAIGLNPLIPPEE